MISKSYDISSLSETGLRCVIFLRLCLRFFQRALVAQICHSFYNLYLTLKILVVLVFLYSIGVNLTFFIESSITYTSSYGIDIVLLQCTDITTSAFPSWIINTFVDIFIILHSVFYTNENCKYTTLDNKAYWIIASSHCDMSIHILLPKNILAPYL